MTTTRRTKRIQSARGWCATVGGLCKLYPSIPPLRRPGHPFFWGSQPCVPAAWLAELLLLAGDIESNPGPKPTLKTLSHTRTQPPHLPNIFQRNANGIRSTVEELKHLMRTTHPDVVTIQESKLTSASRTPQIPHFTAIRTDREHKQGGGLITYIKSDTTFTHIKTPQAINTDDTGIQLLKIHRNTTSQNTHKTLQGHHHSQHIHSTKKHHNTTDTDITNSIQYITDIPNSIITGDVNAHTTLWHSYTDNHRGELISETLSNSNHITLNTDTPTRSLH